MIKFGTGGWRAIIADGFTKSNLQLLSFSLGRMMIDQGVNGKGIVIGYDRRFLSKESAHWAAEVFAALNIHVMMINRSSPTPLIMYAVKQLGLPFGMAITASHNPAIYNGVKVFTSGGCDARESVTKEIEQYAGRLDGEAIAIVDYDEALQKGIITEFNPLNSYLDSILSLINVEAIKNAGLRVALDPLYGVSQTSLRTILMTARCEVEVIHDRHDTLFGGHLPAPNEETLGPLSACVKEHHYDLGIATDGDADRLGVIDDHGDFVHPNRLLTLLYYYLLEYRGWRGPVVRNNSTTHILDDLAKAYGQVCYEVPVGFKYVAEKMVETDAIIGGESSGGLTVKGHIQGKDGIYAASLLIEMIAVTGKALSVLYKEITDRFGMRYTRDLEVHFTEKEKETLKKKLITDQQRPEFPFDIDHVSYKDGCKVYFKDGGWIIARFSGTEPLLRIGTEMRAEKDAEQAMRIFKTFLGVKNS